MKYIFMENPGIDKEECYEKAKLIKREIDNTNRQINRNTDKYFKNNIPLSSCTYHNNTVYSIYEGEED